MGPVTRGSPELTIQEGLPGGDRDPLLTLVESEARFQELITAIREVFWIVEVDLRRVHYVSPAYESIWARKCEQLYLDPREWISALEEEDRQKLTDLYSWRQREPFEATFSISRPDGSHRWIRHRGFPIFDGDDKTVRIAGISADITDARLANQALNRTQRLLASILNSSQDAIFSEGPDGVVTTWNPAAEKMFGYSAAEIIGRPGHLLLGPDQAQEREWISNQTRQGFAVKNLAAGRRHKGGQIIPVLVTAFPVRDESGTIIGCSTIAHDMSERRQLEEKLSTVEAQLRVVLETTGEHVIVVDREWRVIYINRGRSGESVDDAVGRTLWSVEADLLGTPFEEELRKAMAQRVPRRFEGYLAAARMWLSCGAYPTETGMLVLARDVTEKHAIDEQLRSSQKMEAIGQLAAGIAHEINTPIQYVGDNTLFLKECWEQVSDILELAARLLGGKLSEEAETRTRAELSACIKAADLEYLFQEVPKAIDQTLDGIGRVAKIVRAMKEFSHPGSEEKRAVDLNRAIEATITIARNEWKYIAEVDLHLDTDLPMVVCQAGEINQMLLNLLVNAAHAIAEAQKRGDKAQGTITITTQRDDSWAEIRIQDSGTGIPEEVRDKVFDPFFTTKDVGKGTGQGLTLAQTVIVKKHSGKIWFDTELGKGTTFIVRLPIAGTEGTGR